MVFSVQNLEIKFQDEILLENLNLDVNQQDHVVIMVREVENSTAILKACSGLIPITSGQILLDGMDLTTKLHSKKREQLRGHIGFVNEYGGLLESLNVLDNLRLPLQYHAMCDSKEADRRIEELACDLDIATFLHAQTSELHWMHTRFFNLLRALVICPRMLFIDKLETGLSRERINAALTVISKHQAREGFGVVRTTSAYQVDFATRVYRIKDYNLVLDTFP